MIERKDLQINVETIIQQKISNYYNTIPKANYIDSSIIYKELTECGFITVTPPMGEPIRMSFLTMDSLKNYKSGKSIKPGNIKLNIKLLIDEILEILASITNQPIDTFISKIYIALNLWKAINKVLTVEITKDEAFVIVALWKYCDGRHKIDVEDGYNAVKELCKRYGEQEISKIKYHYTIDALVAIDCIELNEGIVWLREWIIKRYIESI